MKSTPDPQPPVDRADPFDTIAAIATGQVISAIGIIRVSGPNALAVVDRVFRPLRGERLSVRRDRLLVLGELLSPEGIVLDQCLATISRGPESYTGEDTAELQCHGSPLVLRLGLESLFAAGARQARAGEFTRRAFLNGRMDLTQAEAVVDLIDAESVPAAENAAAQLGGAIRRKTDGLYERLAAICSHYHAVLDYPDEDIDPFELSAYQSVLDETAAGLTNLLATFRRGDVLKNGVPCVILGRPNVGKSSLLNALLGYERAIVTDVPGTTRDAIEERAVLGGVLLRLWDTAGLRESADPIEQEGVARARNAADSAELVLAVLDGSEPLTTEDDAVLQVAAAAPKHIVVVNKADLPAAFTLKGSVLLSARTGSGLDRLESAVAAIFAEAEPVPTGEVLTSPRQADAVRRALEYVRAAQDAMVAGVTPDAVLTEVEGAMSALGELTGRTVREDITNGIFARFCVGK